VTAEGRVLDAFVVGVGFVVDQYAAADDTASVMPFWSLSVLRSNYTESGIEELTVKGREVLGCSAWVLQFINGRLHSVICHSSGKM
jgi:hypothetical protein